MTTPISTPQYIGDFAAGSTIRLLWDTFGASAESITMSGLAVTDIEVYKGSSMTQRSSDAGYTLLDTDGIDLDGATGIHGIEIDLDDDTDSGFFAIGNDYVVVINSITVNSQTVRFCLGSFSIQNRFNSAGVGDYAHTLTIRTTGGTPVAGVSVWVNSSNARSGSVAGTKVTDTNGQVTVNLTYGTYYIFCNLSSYTFAAASFTSSAGSVAFTKDVATAVATGSTSFYADSFLTRARSLARDSLDEPTVVSKYDDDKLTTYLESAYIIVLNEKNRNSKTPAVVKQEITITSGVTEYALPHVMGTFYGLYHLSDTGCKSFYDGRGRFNPSGQGVWLEGNTLHIQSVDSIGQGETLVAEWIPSGVARLHNGTCTVDTTGTIVTLGATPNDGTLDTHVQAYAGGVFRSLGASGTTVTGNYLQERNITAYDHETRKATLDVALDPIPTSNDGYVYYEIAPAIYKGMDTVVALYAAYRIMSIEGNSKRANGILAAYRNELRNVRLTEYFSNLPEAPKVRMDSGNNRRFRR